MAEDKMAVYNNNIPVQQTSLDSIVINNRQPMQNIRGVMMLNTDPNLQTVLASNSEQPNEMYLKPSRLKPVDGQSKKKSSFQITGVVDRDQNNEDIDSVDDLDDTCETHTEDVSSDVFDDSKVATPGHEHQDEAMATDNLSDGSISPLKDRRSGSVTKPSQDSLPGRVGSDMQSRFKVVKIETTEPFRRGRWLCSDFLDPASDKVVDRTDRAVDELGSGNSSASSSIHYVQGADDPGSNPLMLSNASMQDVQLGHGTYSSSGAMANGIPYHPHHHHHHHHHHHQTLPAEHTHIGSQQKAGSHSSGESQIYTGKDYLANVDATNSATTSVQGKHPVTSIPISQTSSIQTNINTGNASDFSHLAGANLQNTNTSPNNETTNIVELATALQSNMGMDIGDRIQTIDGASIDSESDEDGAIGRKASHLTPPLLEMMSGQSEDERTLLNVFSGASTVAIDNKIEQAMDLVKSHLMFAVREEVEVLKEQIKELLEKNSQLEYENQLLKSNASPETLAKLSNATDPQPQTSSTT